METLCLQLINTMPFVDSASAVGPLLGTVTTIPTLRAVRGIEAGPSGSPLLGRAVGELASRKMCLSFFGSSCSAVC
eukprot:2833984-Amphidinium_carterae.1